MGLRSLSKVVAALSLLTIAAGCASQETVQALREPSLPPVAVLKAEQGGKLYRNISIQEIEGAPEFRWFDGGAVLTTRPTRRPTWPRCGRSSSASSSVRARALSAPCTASDN